jgi:hypothetical protein
MRTEYLAFVFYVTPIGNHHCYELASRANKPFASTVRWNKVRPGNSHEIDNYNAPPSDKKKPIDGLKYGGRNKDSHRRGKTEAIHVYP